MVKKSKNLHNIFHLLLLISYRDKAETQFNKLQKAENLCESTRTRSSERASGEKKGFEFSLDFSPRICVMRMNFNGDTLRPSNEKNTLNANNFVTRREKRKISVFNVEG
jgi:hypothetical protein